MSFLHDLYFFQGQNILLLAKIYFSDKVLLWVTHQLVTLSTVQYEEDTVDTPATRDTDLWARGVTNSGGSGWDWDILENYSFFIMFVLLI